MATYKVTGPDGKQYRITAPDGATQEQVMEFVQRQTEAQQEQDLTLGQEAFRGAEMASRGFTDSALETAAALPEATALGMRKLGLPAPEAGTYERGLKDAYMELASALSRPFQDEIAELGPLEPRNALERGLYGAGRGAADAASILLPAAGAAKVSKAGTLTNNVARALGSQPLLQVASGVAGGAVGEATDNPYLGTAAALAVPAAAGTAQGLRGALDNYLSSRDLVRNAPTTEALRQAGGAAANRARASGVVVKPESFQGFLKDVSDDLGDQIDDALHPKVSAALKNLGKRAEGESSIQQLMNARTMVSDVAGSLEPSERRLAGIVRDRLDDYIANLGTDDLAGGAAEGVGENLREMRQIWTRLRKTEVIEDAIAKARNQASGFENGLRTQFRSLLNNKKKIQPFSKEEREALQKVVQGTPTRNAMRLLGKFGFDFKQNTNALGAALGAGAGYAVDPLGSLVVPAVGSAARAGAERSTVRAADLAKALTASGGGPKASPAASQNLLTGPLLGILAARGKEPAVDTLLGR